MRRRNSAFLGRILGPHSDRMHIMAISRMRDSYMQILKQVQHDATRRTLPPDERESGESVRYHTENLVLMTFRIRVRPPLKGSGTRISHIINTSFLNHLALNNPAFGFGTMSSLSPLFKSLFTSTVYPPFSQGLPKSSPVRLFLFLSAPSQSVHVLKDYAHFGHSVGDFVLFSVRSVHFSRNHAHFGQ